MGGIQLVRADTVVVRAWMAERERSEERGGAGFKIGTYPSSMGGPIVNC